MLPSKHEIPQTDASKTLLALRESEEKFRLMAVAAEELEKRVKERTLQLEQQSHRLRVLADQVATTEQRERKRIAALIHDHLQQILVAGKLQLGQTLKSLEQKQYDKALRSVQRADIFLNDAIQASRSLTVELRPPVLYEDGLTAAFQWLTRKFEADHHLEVILDLQETPVAMTDGLKIMVFESVKELLFNVTKHAKVGQAKLSFKYQDDHSFYLSVEDKGVGFNLIPEEKMSLEGGMGLFSIRERLKLLNAKCKITACPNAGAKIEIIIPAENFLSKEKEAGRNGEDGNHQKNKIADDERNAIRILLVDDHKIVREGIANILKEKPRFKVVAQAENGLEAVEKARQFCPDVIVMDVNMPKLNGIEATRRIKSEFPQIQIIGLSVLDEPDVADSMKKAGAVTLLNKAGDPQELIEAILAKAPHVLSPQE